MPLAGFLHQILIRNVEVIDNLALFSWQYKYKYCIQILFVLKIILDSTVTDECHTFRECTAGCICTSMGKCVCLSKPSTTSEINKEQVRKTQYEAAFGHGRVRLLRPSQYNGKSHLRLAELQKLSRPTIFPGTSLTRVGSGKLVELPTNQFHRKNYQKY